MLIHYFTGLTAFIPLIILINILCIIFLKKLWLPVFFLVAYTFLPADFFHILQTSPLLTLLCFILGYGLYFLKTKFDTSKNNNSPIIKSLIIPASNHFPFGIFILFKLLNAMPELIIRTNVKLHQTPSMEMTAGIKKLLSILPYINIIIAGYFCCLGIFYIYAYYKNMIKPKTK